MSKKRPAFSGNPDLRRGMQVPGPPIAEIEAKLLCWLTPESFKPLRLTTGEKKLRDRILTLPTIMAVVLSLVYRRISGLSEVVRVLESEGLLWVEPLKVSKQALSKRLAVLPTELFRQIFELVTAQIQSQADKLPIGGLLIFDLGFFNFIWFDAFTDSGKFFVTRLRQKTADQVVRTLSSGTLYKDEIIKMGLYRSNPCHHEVRLVSVLWGKNWYCYLTNVKEPEKLSAQQVCELYRRRWRIEEAFLLTKRLLGLSYLWVGGNNGVSIQVYATWIFYACLNDLCSSVAVELGQPKERISVEMVFRGLYHFSRSVLRGENTDAVTYLVEHHKMLGLIKQERKRHRENAAYYQEIWGSTA